MKRLWLCAMLAFMTMLVMGCGEKKELLTEESFMELMLEKGFSVSEYNALDEGEICQWDAVKEGQIVSLEIFDETQNAVDKYDFVKKIHTNNEEMCEIEKEEKLSDGDRYFVYTYFDEESYMMISQRENTILKVIVPKGEERELKTIVKGTGY